MRAINTQLAGSSSADADVDQRTVRLVDLFGFEMLRVNSYEQFCMNVADERLHQLFVEQVRSSEIQ